MREILFRGKRPDNKEWVYGFYRNDGFGEHEDIIENDYKLYIIDRETLGQYTGLKDKNDKRIFEGDIVGIDGEDGYFQITWHEDEAMFGLDGDRLSVSFDNYYPREVEVFDNIYDNPELLEKEKATD